MTVKIAVDASGTGEPFVLLHGLGASRRLWHRAAPLLVASGRRVLAPDLPGFGDSPPAGPGFEFAAVTDALARALRRRARGPFDLLGSSLGGGHHLGGPGVEAAGVGEVVGEALAEAGRLAHVDDPAEGVLELVGTGRVGDRAGRGTLHHGRDGTAGCPIH